MDTSCNIKCTRPESKSDKESVTVKVNNRDQNQQTVTAHLNPLTTKGQWHMTLYKQAQNVCGIKLVTVNPILPC